MLSWRAGRDRTRGHSLANDGCDAHLLYIGEQRTKRKNCTYSPYIVFQYRQNCSGKTTSWRVDVVCRTSRNECTFAQTVSLHLHSCIMWAPLHPHISLCFVLVLSPLHLHLGCISQRKCLYCPFAKGAHTQTHTHTHTSQSQERDLTISLGGGEQRKLTKG